MSSARAALCTSMVAAFSRRHLRKVALCKKSTIALESPLCVCRLREHQGATDAALLSIVGSHSAPRLQMADLKQSRTTLRIRHTSPTATAASFAVLGCARFPPMTAGVRFLVPHFSDTRYKMRNCRQVWPPGTHGVQIPGADLLRTPAPKLCDGQQIWPAGIWCADSWCHLFSDTRSKMRNCRQNCSPEAPTWDCPTLDRARRHPALAICVDRNNSPLLGSWDAPVKCVACVFLPRLLLGSWLLLTSVHENSATVERGGFQCLGCRGPLRH